MQEKDSGIETITVLIADDHAILREGLRGLLEEQEGISVIGEAVTGADAIQKARELKPDILLLDLIMPVLSGVEALKVISEEEQSIKTIILTGADDDVLLAHSIQAGAKGYLLKDTASSQLVEAIRTVASGGYWLPAELTGKLFDGISKQPTPDDSDKISLLTPREFEILRLLGEAHTNSAIAEALFISEHTVKAHMHSLLDKLGLENRVDAIRFAIRNGLTEA